MGNTKTIKLKPKTEGIPPNLSKVIDWILSQEWELKYKIWAVWNISFMMDQSQVAEIFKMTSSNVGYQCGKVLNENSIRIHDILSTYEELKKKKPSARAVSIESLKTA